jgi:poly [ADP-ribose] polymerase
MTPISSRWVSLTSAYRPECLLTKVLVGKLAKSTILSGFAALKELSEVISQPNSTGDRGFSNFRAACEELTSRYYS